jgi:hypothetical protein
MDTRTASSVAPNVQQSAAFRNPARIDRKDFPGDVQRSPQSLSLP